MPDEPLHHLARVGPPWLREGEAMTECGRRVVDVAGPVDTWDEVAAFYRKHGRQRAAFVYCMTCTGGGVVRRQSWEKDAQEITLQWLSRSRYTRDGNRNAEPDRYLHALAALVAAHQDEFDAMVTPPEGVVDLASRRRGEQR